MREQRAYGFTPRRRAITVSRELNTHEPCATILEKADILGYLKYVIESKRGSRSFSHMQDQDGMIGGFQ
jgi:hypothetical protein